jgi:hypothetical protein
MRCKACNKKLLFIYWNKRINNWETLCTECREGAEVDPTLEELTEGYVGVDLEDLD